MSSTIAPPPTNNKLDKDQRSRLLRSARKLEALLGTTVQLLDSETEDSDLNDFDDGASVPLYAKRQGIYGSTTPLKAFSSPASSVSSLASSSDQQPQEKGYYGFVNQGHDGPDHRLPPLIPASGISPVSSRSVSPVSGRGSFKTRKHLGTKGKANHTGPQLLSQPLLLRLRALPADRHIANQPKSTISVKEGTVTPKANIPAPIQLPPPPALVTPSERRKLKVDSVLGPLSPINHSHFQSHSICITDLPSSPLTPIFDPASPVDVELGLTDREKRRKMAKLQRTLGETIPPELVFGALPGSSSTTTTEKKKTRRRSYSMSILSPRPGSVAEFFGTSSSSSAEEEPQQKKLDKGKGKAKENRPLPTPPSAETPAQEPKPEIRALPKPPPLSAVAPFLAQSTSMYPSPPVSSVSLPETVPTSNSPSLLRRKSSRKLSIKKRKPRPTSLNLGTSSAFVAAELRLLEKAKETKAAEEEGEDSPIRRGTVSLDEERSERVKDAKMRHTKSRERGHRSTRSGPAYHNVPDAPFAASSVEMKVISGGKGKPVWKRKEREWSGEWNLQDMDEVAKALRGLKAR